MKYEWEDEAVAAATEVYGEAGWAVVETEDGMYLVLPPSSSTEEEAFAYQVLSGRTLEHSLRVGKSLMDGVVRAAGYLHDVVEDGHATLEDVRTMFGDAVADTVDAVTRREGERYFDFVARAGAHPRGAMVKRADLYDNMKDLPMEHSLYPRYVKALRILATGE